jgi:DNA-binding transcriptional LysR family regulator
VNDAELAMRPPAVEVAGHLRISAPALLGRHLLAPILPDYLLRFPKVQADLTLTDRAVNLIEEGLEVAIRIGTLEDTSLLARRLGEVRVVTCASPDYLARHGEPQSPHELKRHDCLVFAVDPQECCGDIRRPEGESLLSASRCAFEPTLLKPS